MRTIAMERTDGFCEFCGDIATQVHHVKYPKRFGEEHPDSLVPVCDKCHKISHGVIKVNALSNVTQLSELSPNGVNFKYLLSGGRIFASAKAWSRVIQIPECLRAWFESGLERQAILRRDFNGSLLVGDYLDVKVYRWHAVGNQLRVFDREWHKNQYQNRPVDEQRAIKKFHESYEMLLNWGYDLQERALASLVNPEVPNSSGAISPEMLLSAIKDAVAPRLFEHDEKINQHDIIISEIQKAVPTLRNSNDFITVKQALSELGLDYTIMPLAPDIKDNLSGLVGKKLKEAGVKQGKSVVSRIDGTGFTSQMNTYQRHEIYSVIKIYQSC